MSRPLSHTSVEDPALGHLGFEEAAIRTRIVSELHDGILQVLTGAVVRITLPFVGVDG